MQVLTAIDPDTARGPAKDLFDQIEHSLKRVPNMVRILANSPPILEAYLRFNEAFGRTKMTPRLRGLITVAIAELNGCDYTLSTAMALGRREGVAVAELEAARRGEASEPYARAALGFAAAVVHERGHVKPSAIEDLRHEGFDDEEIVELIACVALNVFRNYFNLVAGTEIDFPVVKTRQTTLASAQSS